MANGWISLHRKIQDHWLYKKKPFNELQAWIDILLEANHEEQKVLIGGKILVCKRGESIKSQETWAERWGWNRSAVRRFLDLLKSEAMIELKNEHKTTRLTVCNYNTYQNMRPDNDQIMTTKRPDYDHKMNTNNKDNKENNYNNENKNINIRGRFMKPTVQEVKDYAGHIGFLELFEHPDKFIDHYESNGWMVGKNPMKDWRAAVRTWKRNRYDKQQPTELYGRPIEAGSGKQPQEGGASATDSQDDWDSAAVVCRNDQGGRKEAL